MSRSDDAPWPRPPEKARKDCKKLADCVYCTIISCSTGAFYILSIGRTLHPLEPLRPNHCLSISAASPTNPKQLGRTRLLLRSMLIPLYHYPLMPLDIQCQKYIFKLYITWLLFQVHCDITLGLITLYHKPHLDRLYSSPLIFTCFRNSCRSADPCTPK